MFDINEFQNKWSYLIFVVNVYNFFTGFFFIGIAGFPTDYWMLAECASEVVLMLDIVFR